VAARQGHHLPDGYGHPCVGARVRLQAHTVREVKVLFGHALSGP